MQNVRCEQGSEEERKYLEYLGISWNIWETCIAAEEEPVQSPEAEECFVCLTNSRR